MTEPGKYDAIIIGSGQGGGPLSTALAAAGKRTALIEREHVGGTCINEGCTPTKTVIASARVAYLARRGSDYGVKTGPISVDMKIVRQRKRDIVESFREGSTKAIESGGVNLIAGEAHFTGPHSLKVSLTGGGELDLQANTIVIDTGGRPARPPIPGLDSVDSLDSTSVMELEAVPDHLIVLGGGYIGLEFSQAFRRFGSRVTIVQAAEKLAEREDDDISDAILDIMRGDGIEVILSARVTRVEPANTGVVLTIETPDGGRRVEGSHLLIAAGRAPNTEALNLDVAGVRQTERGFVSVNDRFETNVPGVYALGDVTGEPQFTHISYDDFRILRDNLIFKKDRTRAGRLIPYTVFIDPQLGRVGMSESEARKEGRDIQVAKMPMSHVARAIEMDETRGLVKAIVDRESKEILGCAVLGIEGGEIMAMFEIAMMGRVPYTTLRDGIFSHPTLAELMNNLFSSLSD